MRISKQWFIVQWYARTRGFRRFLWRLQMGYRAFVNAERLYGRGLITALEFEGSIGRGVSQVKAHMIQNDGKIKKPVVYP